MSKPLVPTYPAMAHAAAAIIDPAERQLWLAHAIAGDEYEAAVDGATYHACPADVADARYWAAHREYNRTGRALIEYRRASIAIAAWRRHL